MNRIHILVTCIVLFASCTSKFEVREDEAAISYDNTTGEVNNQIFHQGSHEVNSNEKVVIYKIHQQHANLSFDFLFKDASEGLIEFSIDYTPIVNSLPDFFRKYKTTNLPVTIEAEVKSRVRDLLITFSKEGINDKRVFNEVERLLKSGEIAKMISIDSINFTQVKY